MQTQVIRRMGETIVLALLYYIAARFGSLMAVSSGYAAPIWPAAGIALGAVLILGKRAAPGIWLGALLANGAISFDGSNTASLVTSLLLPAAIGVGATLQALAGAGLIRHFVGFPTPLDRTGDVLKFLALGGPLSCLISASVGTTAVLLAGRVPPQSYAFTWWAWWIGDAMGVLVATPLVLTWFGQPHPIWRRRRKTVVLPICLAFAVIVGVFSGAKEPYFSPPHLRVAWFVLTGGLAFTGLLGAFLLVTSGHAMLIEQLVAQRTQDLERTRQAEQAALQLAAIVTSSDDAIIGKTLDGIIVSWNAGATRMYGYSASEALGRPISLLIPPELAGEMAAIVERLWRGERIDHLETVRLRKDGCRIDISLTTSPIRDAEGRVTGVSAIARDISERKRTEKALRDREARIRRLVDANIIGIVIGKLGGRISEANEAFLKISGYSREEVLAERFRWTDMTPPQYDAADAHALEELRTSGRCTPYEKEYTRKDGSLITVLVACALFEGSQDEGVSFVLDLTERKLADERIHHMVGHDALTGLPNRTLLQDRMRQAIAFAHRSGLRVAVLFIDLDYFKNINDSLGHHVGDQVLKMTAMRLQQCLRVGDSVARLGGDEFVLILPLLGDSGDAARVARKALDSLAQPFNVELHQLHLGGSIGISIYPDDGVDVDSLMRAADTAMYHAKETGRGNVKFFTAALNQAVQRRLDIGKRLREALAREEFILHYQPQVEMDSGIIFSAEALLRWQPPGMQPISCVDFIANAEESGLIVSIGEWVLRQACRQLKIWRDAGHPQLKIAVNLSPRQLDQVNFCALVGQILDEAGIPATALELEITESMLMQRSEYNLAMLTRLSDMGIALSVDDFGTGYSSLAYLQRFPVHSLKIDQSFVRDIGKDQNDTALVTAIIAMAASLRLGVIAEGVETLQQAQFLMAHGCHAAQGFYYSKAVRADAFSELIAHKFEDKNPLHG
ncbi:bifunctional diguanylate cyclase/phosphodiesterase [Massilia antarctica]|uniref:bifunctional diguanylate cyclase/phosphodiesterase n=1 Tax=Massilia antarctica TaxID=2765360 RepID=UPI00226ED827|nr:EAL domain-containing protein [Massilia sp. H27-R4]MCY0911763.1 EAL domain-containing protein [Massilia sp. H27-R4]